MAAPAQAPRGKALTPAKPSPVVKISRLETGDGKKTKRAKPAKPARARQSPAIPNEPVQEPGRRSVRKPSMPTPSPAAAKSATPARKTRVARKTIFKNGVRKTRK